MTPHILIALAIAVLGIVPLDAVAIPPNDDCVAATEVTALPFSDEQDTTTATAELTEPELACGSGGAGHSVWYRVTPPASGILCIKTCGSDYDTMLAALSDSSCGSFTELACNDDSCGLASRLDLPVTAGVPVKIFSPSYGASAGHLAVHIALAPGGDPDGDGVIGCEDDCPDNFDPLQADQDNDGVGDACDPCPTCPGIAIDSDGDGVCDPCDFCPGDAADRCESAFVCDQQSSLQRVNVATGATSTVGDMGMDTCRGLAFEPATGRLFAVGSDPRVGRALFRVDTATGAATLIGRTSPDGAFLDDLSFRHADSALFGLRFPNLARIDPTTGGVTDIGPTESPGGIGNALAFDAADVLYLANDVELATLDTTTGLSSTVGAFTFPSGCAPFASQWVEAMDLGPEGALLGLLTCTENFTTSLVNIDQTTGAITVRAPIDQYLSGIAYRRCGNGIIDVGETCDDGNTEDGDCCSSACTIESPGAACADEGNGCTDDRCDGSGVCHHEPNTTPCDDGDPCSTGDVCQLGHCSPGPPLSCPACTVCLAGSGCRPGLRTECLHSLTPGKAELVLTDGTVATRDRLRWALRMGERTPIADLGNPPAGDDYALCVFDRRGLVVGATAPGGTHWHRVGSRGFTYADPSRSSDGVDHLKIRVGGASGLARMSISASGSDLGLDLPTLGLQLPVTVQLQAEGGACWEASYETSVRANGGAQFKGGGD